LLRGKRTAELVTALGTAVDDTFANSWGVEDKKTRNGGSIIVQLYCPGRSAAGRRQGFARRPSAPLLAHASVAANIRDVFFGRRRFYSDTIGARRHE
jgi:hypothetical protein